MSDKIIVQNVAPDEGLAQSNPANDNPEHALFSKIARLPNDIHEELNRRLFNGQVGRQVLAWLNGLPAVKEILKTEFDGKAINHPNLTNWRQTGYQRWLRQKQLVSATKELCVYATDIVQAGGGHLAPAAAAVASGKILEFLDTADSAPADPNNLVKCAAAASALLKGEHTHARIEIAKERLRQREMNLLLKRDKQQRDATAITLRALRDARAKEIEASSSSHAEKIELLGLHHYGELWEPRPIPVPQPSPS
jgi:hypothetical protein